MWCRNEQHEIADASRNAAVRAARGGGACRREGGEAVRTLVPEGGGVRLRGLQVEEGDGGGGGSTKQRVTRLVPGPPAYDPPVPSAARVNAIQNLSAGHRHPGTTGAPTMDRQWRDQRQALMSVCCSLGCEMSDLFMLC